MITAFLPVYITEANDAPSKQKAMGRVAGFTLITCTRAAIIPAFIPPGVAGFFVCRPD